METLESLTFYFFLACGIAAIGLLVLFILVVVLFVKVKRLSTESSNQLSKQVNMMSDFCYTNPTIVPGEELSRRGFSMYRGNDSFNEDLTQRSKYTSTLYLQDSRSKF